MQIHGRWFVLAAILYASLRLVAQTVAAQSNPATAQITVYESPT
jgi:hypothetical protein